MCTCVYVSFHVRVCMFSCEMCVCVHERVQSSEHYTAYSTRCCLLIIFTYNTSTRIN